MTLPASKFGCGSFLTYMSVADGSRGKHKKRKGRNVRILREKQARSMVYTHCGIHPHELVTSPSPDTWGCARLGRNVIMHHDAHSHCCEFHTNARGTRVLYM